MSIKQLQGTLVFVQVQTPTKCYEESKGKEWKASVVVDEDTADQWEENYPKQAAKSVKTSEFQSIYKIDPPFPDQKKQFIITVRKNTKLANDEPVPEKYRPRVMEQVGNNRIDVTNEKLPANGSIGIISVEHYDAKMGPVARLKNVLVTDMVEYESKAGADYNPGDEFDSASTPAPKAEEKPVKATKGKAKPPVEEDNSDDPF